MTKVIEKRTTLEDLYTDKYPHISAKGVELEISDLAKGKRIEHQKVRESFLEAFKKANPKEFDKTQNNHITTSNINNFFQHGLNEFLSYSEHQLKEYISKKNDTVKRSLILFATKLINIIDPKTLQNAAEDNIEVREALHTTYQKIEDALEPNCINRVGDLLDDKQVRASILMNAAKEAKKQGIKFEPSPYIPDYECYNRKLHGEPIPYLKKYFGEFLASCNEEKVDYLYRGDIPVIDPQLRGALYRNFQKEFEKLTSIAGRKSQKEMLKMTSKGREKLNKIISLDVSSKK